MGARDDTGLEAGVFVSTADFRVVAGAGVYFGHQSVGANILRGLEDLPGHPDDVVLRVVRLEDYRSTHHQEGVFLHSAIGRNGHPDSKCEDFQRTVDGLGGDLDLALFKFCYVDFADTSDVRATFDEYVRTLGDLKRRHPRLVFVHVTVPLRTCERGAGVWLCEALGRRNRAKHANARRNEFNEMLRAGFAGEALFDLAAVEATRPDGRREAFELDGRTHDALVPAYSDDGGHLNEVGRLRAAAALVRCLAEALRSDGRGTSGL